MKKANLNPVLQQVLDNLKVEESKESAVQMFNLKRNASSDLFIEMIRKALHRGSYKLRVRGSLSDRVSLRKKGEYVSNESVKLSQADRYRIYIEDGGVKFGDEYWRKQYSKIRDKFNVLQKTVLRQEVEITDLNKALYDKFIKEKEESEPESMRLEITDKASFKALQQIAFKYNVLWVSSGSNILHRPYKYVHIKKSEGKYAMYRECTKHSDQRYYKVEYSLADLIEFLERITK